MVRGPARGARGALAWAGIAALCGALGCEEDPCPRGSMLESDGALLVTESEHPTGWGEAACADCHALEALHRSGCTPEVDTLALTEMIEEEGLESCASCHGDNGVQP